MAEWRPGDKLPVTVCPPCPAGREFTGVQYTKASGPAGLHGEHPCRCGEEPEPMYEVPGSRLTELSNEIAWLTQRNADLTAELVRTAELLFESRGAHKVCGDMDCTDPGHNRPPHDYLVHDHKHPHQGGEHSHRHGHISEAVAPVPRMQPDAQGLELLLGFETRQDRDLFHAWLVIALAVAVTDGKLDLP